MPAVRRPIQGSRGFYPRVRAKKTYPRIKSWGISNEAKPLGFAGFKAGMTHATVIDSNSNSKTKGQSIVRAVTILDCPPLSVFGFNVYSKTPYGFKTTGTVLSDKLDKNLSRKFGAKKIKTEEQMKKIDGNNVSYIRLLVHTKPGFKKTPEVFELGVGGSSEKQLEYAKGMLGKELKASEILKAGDYVDVFANSKGKGFQGPVKRFGIRILGRKFQQMHRHVGALGTTEPGKIRSTVPAAGQLGWQSRMDYNKKVLQILDGKKVVMSGGFLRYGNLSGEAVVIDGSVVGTTKRLVKLRFAIRGPTSRYPADLKSLSLTSKQGV